MIAACATGRDRTRPTHAAGPHDVAPAASSSPCAHARRRRRRPDVALACAVLSERYAPRGPRPRRRAICCLRLTIRTRCRIRRPVGRRISPRSVDPGGGTRKPLARRNFRRATFAGYADRLARRRASGSNRFLFASGTGGVMAAESGVHDAEFIVALDASRSRSGEGVRGLDLESRARSIRNGYSQPAFQSSTNWTGGRAGCAPCNGLTTADPASGARRRPDPEESARLLVARILPGRLTDADLQLIRRLRFAGLRRTFEDLVRRRPPVST